MPRNAGGRKKKTDESHGARGLAGILEKIRESRNFDFREYKRGTLMRRIQRRMQDRGKRTAREYSALLDRDPTELDALVGAMLIKVTSFFRDPESWEELSAKAIPQMLSEKRPGEEIRVWCAGCATGEEAFTAAMVLADAMGPSFANQEIRIFGTDADEKAIAYARKGQYTREQVQSVPPRYLAEWFIEDGEGYSVRKELRRSVVFGLNNLVSDAPISRLDLLVCRNVFIYLDAVLQKRVLTRFNYALRRNGILLLGKSELIPFAGRIFEPVDVTSRLYRKDGGKDRAVAHERLMGLLEQQSVAPEPEGRGGEPGSIELFHGDVLHALSAPLMVASVEGDLMFWNHAAANLWSRSDREVVGKKVAALNLPGLSGELLIEKTAAVREGRSEREWGAGVVGRPSSGNAVHVSVEVSRMRGPDGELSGLLYVAHDVTELRSLEGELRRANDERQSTLEELQTLNEEMQSSNEELETTNEELQSANEELQTTNEELQSTNKELETANEELQSTNAELDATNRELAHRTEEMNTLALKHRAIIRSLSSAVIVVDPAGKVTVWNLAAERLLGVTESQALGHVLWSLHVPALNRGALAKLRKALGQNLGTRLEEISYQLPGGTAGRAIVSAIPVLDGGMAFGAVIIFEDVTRLANMLAENAQLKESDGHAAKDA